MSSDQSADAPSGAEIDVDDTRRMLLWKLTPPLLYRYVFLEILSPFLLSLFVFTGILFLARSLALIDLVVNKNVSVLEILFLFSLVIPQFLEIAIPMALLLAIILAFGRLSADSELVVMRATGISLRQLVAPVLLFASCCFVASLMLGLWIRPWANYRLGVGMFEMAKMRASAGLIGGTFNEFGPLTIYSEKIDDTGSRLNNVVIGDRRDPEKPRDFTAKYGQIISDNISRTLTLRLYDGSIHEGRGDNYNVTYFDVNNIVLSHNELVDQNIGREGKKPHEMYIGELNAASGDVKKKVRPEYTAKLAEEQLSKKEVQQIARYDVEFHRRFVIPFSCLAVALIGMALGVQPSRGGKSWGVSVNVTVGILVVTVYYLALAFATALGEQAMAPAWIMMWIPDAFFAVLALYVFRRIESEEWMAVSQALGDWLLRVMAKLRLDAAGARS